ncbi:MAG: hypothetical protein ACTTHM_05800 [Peptoanaerobacter stomatis]|uniref:hypothetical protein n=1 Tax=Peptoanaerobacter stomatis TaxID=796937 RepID=UPI003F9FDA5C
MSIENDVLPVEKKTSIFTTIKIILAVLLVFLTIIAGTAGVLYLTNNKVKKFINTQIKQYQTRQELKAKAEAKGVSDPRISELAKYYLQMDEEQVADKLIDIKKSDKKSYEKLLSSMMIINSEKTDNVNELIKKFESKKDIIKDEYEKMELAKADENKTTSSYYTSLGIKGAIDAIQSELQTTMNYDKVSSALENMQAKTVARILHYTNPIYIDGIKNRFGNEFLKSVEREMQIYSEFLRKNLSLGQLYSKTEEKIAAQKLQDAESFSDDQLAVIFSNMDYLNAARILNEFSDENKVQDILMEIKNIEDYQMNFDGSYSTVVANSIKVLKKYEEDVDILKKAYEKMQAADLADVIDKLAVDNPVYKTYKIDNVRNFSISEKQMAVDTLKKMKPALVGEIIAQLKNNDKIDKAAFLSRELGIPEP